MNRKRADSLNRAFESAIDITRKREQEKKQRKAEAGEMAIELAKYIVKNQGPNDCHDYITEQAQAVMDKLGDQ